RGSSQHGQAQVPDRGHGGGRRGRRRRRGHSVHQVLESERAGVDRRRAGDGGHQRPAGGPAPDRRMAWPAGVDRAPLAGDPGGAADPGRPPERSDVREPGAAAGVRAGIQPGNALAAPGDPGAGGHLHPPGLLARDGGRDRPRAVRRGLEGRLLLPLPQVEVRHVRPRLRRHARADQPGRSSPPLCRRQHHRRWRRSRGSCLTMANIFTRAGNGFMDAANGVMDWVNERAPALMPMYRKHMTEYYAPKNFNIWYIFGVLSTVILVNQIVTGIFLTMHYKPSAAEAFHSVEYIMRDVEWGWLIRYMHSTGASLFFIAVYLHMFRGLMYGSYRKPRELVWILGMLIYLVLMAEAFLGYVLPWGQMSFWGAKVIISLFGAIPIIGNGLVEWIMGDYLPSDATLTRFFALHVIALPLVLL